jgi:predicted PurR-regulated permease PerM
MNTDAHDVVPVTKHAHRIEVAPKTLGLVLLMAGGCWLLIHLFPVVLVVVVALFLVGTLNPAVSWLQRRGIKRGYGIAIVFTAITGAVLAVCLLTIPALVDQIRVLADKEPQVRGQLANYLLQHRATYSLGRSLLNVKYDALIASSASSALEFSAHAIEVLAYLFSSVFLALYVMVDRDRLRGALFALIPRPYHVRTARVLLNLEAIVGGYIRGQLLTSALMTGFVFIILAICGAPGALAVAVFAGLADVLPYIGGFLSVGAVVGAVASKGAVTAAVVLTIMFVYAEFEARYLVPKIYGKRLRLSSSVVLVALLAGGVLAGITGALLALPVAAAIRMLIEELRVALPGERLDDEIIRERDARAEAEYERLAHDLPAQQAAAVAIEICTERTGPDTAGTPIEETAARLSRTTV